MILRPLAITDAERMLEWMHNDNVTEFFRFNGSEATIESVTEFIIASSNNKNTRHYAAADDNNRYMGTVSLKNIDLENKNAEYAISLHQDAIGKGYARFATDEILNIAFNELHLHRVYLNVLSKNIRAIKFYEKYGFKFEGEFKEHLLHKGKLENLKWYAISKDEWAKKSVI